jgi:hypothetical protein
MFQRFGERRCQSKALAVYVETPFGRRQRLASCAADAKEPRVYSLGCREDRLVCSKGGINWLAFGQSILADIFVIKTKNLFSLMLFWMALSLSPFALGQTARIQWEKASKSCFDFLNNGDLNSARGVCSEAVRAAETIKGDLNPLAQSLSNLGTLLSRLGEYSLAETAYAR